MRRHYCNTLLSLLNEHIGTDIKSTSQDIGNEMHALIFTTIQYSVEKLHIVDLDVTKQNCTMCGISLMPAERIQLEKYLNDNKCLNQQDTYQFTLVTSQTSLPARHICTRVILDK